MRKCEGRGFIKGCGMYMPDDKFNKTGWKDKPNNVCKQCYNAAQREKRLMKNGPVLVKPRVSANLPAWGAPTTFADGLWAERWAV